MRITTLDLMAVAFVAVQTWSLQLKAAQDVPGDKPPAGYHLVAEDNCGTESQTHVVVGTAWRYPSNMVQAADEYRAIVFDNSACVLRYLKPNPAATYKVDVIYVDNGGRVQRLEANGHEVHAAMALPVERSRRFLFDVPKAAYADGEKLELKFIKTAGANAIVSYVRIWSTDATPLGAPPPDQRAAFLPPGPPRPKPLFPVDDPIQRSWLLEDGLVLRRVDGVWEDPATVTPKRIAAAVDKHLERGKAISADLRRLGVTDLEADLGALARAAGARNTLAAEDSTGLEAWKPVYLDVRRAVRGIVFRHPRLHDHAGLLFVRRAHPEFNHQCARRRARYNRLGGEICMLRQIRADAGGGVVSLTEGQFPKGLFSRPDVSFDGERIVFGFAEADLVDRDEGPCENRATQDSIGNGTFFEVWEMALDGRTPPRQITRGTTRREESTDPIYLPDGRIAFMSPRAGGMVQCGDWAWADCLYTVNQDGSDLRQITQAKEGEWDPALMDDGSILFTRWEYVMRFWRPTQLVWSVRPDGAYPRVIAGYLTGERNYARCRQVPGTSKLVCVEAHHHNDGSGNILLVDLKRGRDTSEGEKRLVLGACDCPYPLDEDYVLISYDPEGTGAVDARTAGRMGIYLADAYGGRELVYRDNALSAMYPTPIRPRPVRPIVPDVCNEMQLGDCPNFRAAKMGLSPSETERLGDSPNFRAAKMGLSPSKTRKLSAPEREPSGEFLIQNVHEGLPAEMQGKARYVRVVEAHERHVHTSPCNIWVGMGGFETKTVLGCVPVEPDGSAYFRVPAQRAVFFSVLDEDYRALHTMRMTTYVKPGETVGCVGCHEPMASAPLALKTPLAVHRGPSSIEPPPWGVEALGFPKHVQPILDRHCTRCHDGTKGDDKSFDLRAGDTEPEVFVPNLWTVYDTGYRAHYTYPAYWALLPHVAYADIHQYHTPPGTWGSRASPLVELLAEGHEDVRLDRAEWRVLCAWIDCNVPYLDDYRKFAVDPAIRRAARAAAATQATKEGVSVPE